MKRYLIIAVIFFFCAAGPANAQKVGLKTNALYWGTATPNVGLEVALAERWTFELAGGYNPWTLNSEKNVRQSISLSLLNSDIGSARASTAIL